MNESFEQIQAIQILYEISMSIGVSLDLRKMLKVSLLTFLKKLNCAAGGVHIAHRDERGQPGFEKVHSTPRNTSRNAAYQAALEYVSASLDERSMADLYNHLPVSGQSEIGDYFHIFELPDFGLMILVKNEEPLTPPVIRSLEPLLARLTAAAHACLSEQTLQESLEHRARQVQISTQVAQDIAAAPALDDLFRRVVDLTQERFGYYHAHVYTLEDGNLIMQEGAGEPGRKMKEAGHAIALSAQKSLVARAARSGEPVLISDVSQEAGWLPNPLLPDTQAELAVPIKLDDEILGVLDVQSDTVAGLDAEDQLLLQGLCGQIAVAIQNRRVEVARDRQAAELETVAQVSTAAATILETNRLLQEVVDLTKDRFNLYHAHIYLLDDITNQLNLTAGADDVGRKMTTQGWSIPLDQERSLVARAARTRQGIIANDVRQEPDFLPNPLLPDTRSELAVPLIAGDTVLGVLDVQAAEANHFTDQDVRIQTTLGAQVAVALQNARLFVEQEKTGLLLRERVKGLNCLNDIGLEIESAPPIPQLLQWVTERIPPAMQHPGLCMAAIEFDGQVYGTPDAINMPAQVAYGLYIRGQLMGRLYTAYTEDYDFINEESAMLGAIATRVSGHIENRRLLEQTEAALREANLLRRATEQSLDGSAVTDMNGHILFVNPAWAKMHGYDNEEALLGKPLSIFYTEKQLQNEVKPFNAQVMQKGAHQGEVGHKRKDGTIFPAWMTVSLLKDADGESIGLTAAVQDITERKAREAERERLLVEVEAAYRQYVRQEWDQFLGEQHQGDWHIEYQRDAVPGMQGGNKADKQSEIEAPITLRGQAIGSLNLKDIAPDRHWSSEERTLVEAVSEQLALTVENLRLFDNTQRRATREQLTRQITDQMRAASDIDSVIENGLTALSKALDVSRAYIKLTSPVEQGER